MKLKALLIFATAILPIASAFGGANEENRINSAIEVLRQISTIPEQAVPPSLLTKAYGVAVIPNVIRAAFGLGGRRGKGVLVVRNEKGEWSDPVFVTLTGGNFGFQIGAQATDIILVFKSRKGIDGIASGKLTLGADASVAAGPVGRAAAAATDITFKSEVYSYSRSRGLFAGIALDGSAIHIDKKANGNFYGVTGITAAQIFAGLAPSVPEIADRFTRELDSRAPALPPGEIYGKSASAVRSEPQSEGVKTYALEDPAYADEPLPEL